jgi:hypothetical protein
MQDRASELPLSAIECNRFCELTPFGMDLILRFMGDKSPKAAQKHAAQKQLKADAAKQKKNSGASAKQAPTTKK